MISSLETSENGNLETHLIQGKLSNEAVAWNFHNISYKNKFSMTLSPVQDKTGKMIIQ